MLACGCAVQDPASVIAPLPSLPAGNAERAPPRISGAIGSPANAAVEREGLYRPVTTGGGPGGAAGGSGGAAGGGGDISLDFADTDIREVVAQVLGTMLRADYTIDPAVHGTVTLHASRPMSRAQLLPALRAMLAQVNAALLTSGSLYRVVPATAGNGAQGLSADSGSVVALRFVSAEDIAKVLTPFATGGGHVIANPGTNTVLITGDAGSREALIELVRSFDVDVLAGQSYALFPVTSGDATDFASALQTAFRGAAGSGLAGVVRTVPMARIDSVMVIAPQPQLIEDARRVYHLVEQARRATVRSWHVYYLQNSRSNDVAYVLQQAFTPNNVTAQPTPQAGAGSQGQGSTLGGSGQSGGQNGGQSGLGSTSGIGGGSSGLGIGSSGVGGSGIGGGGLGSSGGNSAGGFGTGAAQAQQPAAANPLLGGLGSGGGNAGGNNETAATMRIIPDVQNNSLLVYATPNENETVGSMLHKVDLLPLQVRIDATIAEVDLNDALQYGTQFFFKSGGINGVLDNATATITNPEAIALDSAFPGFFLGGKGLGGAPIALNALQAVTKVKVLDSPELMVLDNQPAKLQVGNLVPYLTGEVTGLTTGTAATVNTVSYQETGVILNVTPRVNDGGLVELDIDQEVSNVVPGASSSGITSPTFSDRQVQSRVIVQDGQTIGLAGLIQDSVSHGNSGIPFLKDIPLLGLLGGTQTNSRERTELLVLITPHVVHDQRDARALTQDMRDVLVHAAAVPDDVEREPVSGSSDPTRPVRRALHLEQ